MQIINYPGGKARIAPWIIEHFPPHEVYVEAFGGSGAVLIAKEPSRLEIYNDLDAGLVWFFQVLADPVKSYALIKKIDGLYYSPFIDPTPSDDPIELAARFFVRNNTTWAKDKNKNYRTQKRVATDGRTVAEVFKKRKTYLARVAERLKSVTFEHRDALELIERYDGPNVLFYCDPPYFGKRERNLYRNEMMDESAHRALAQALYECQGAVVLSGYSSELYKELYGDWTVVVRQAQTNGKDLSQECLWIKPSQNGEVRRSQAKAIAARSLGEIVRENTRHIISQASKNPRNGERCHMGPKSEGITTALSEAFQKTEDGLSFGEIVRTLGIAKGTLCDYLRRWKSQGLIKQDAITKVWTVSIGAKLVCRDAITAPAERARINRIDIQSQYRLDRIARQRSNLLKEIADGKLSINAAYNLCRPPKSDAGLRKLRFAWRRATEKERELFRAEINVQPTSTPIK
jgi:DNA adenine methylase